LVLLWSALERGDVMPARWCQVSADAGVTPTAIRVTWRQARWSCAHHGPTRWRCRCRGEGLRSAENADRAVPAASHQRSFIWVEWPRLWSPDANRSDRATVCRPEGEHPAQGHERRPGLGDEFISEISASLDRVRDTRDRTRHGRARGQKARWSARQPSNGSPTSSRSKSTSSTCSS